MKSSTALFYLVAASRSSKPRSYSNVSDKELLKAVEGAAPPEIIANATVLNMTPDGKMKTVREGSNGRTCMDPEGAPMCADAGGLEWAKAPLPRRSAAEAWLHLYAEG
jgi:hypothetical protein